VDKSCFQSYGARHRGGLVSKARAYTVLPNCERRSRLVDKEISVLMDNTVISKNKIRKEYYAIP
jgi:hypothetical protein